MPVVTTAEKLVTGSCVPGTAGFCLDGSGHGGDRVRMRPEPGVRRGHNGVMPTVRYGYTETPIGTVLLVAKDDVLPGLYVDDESDTRRIKSNWVRDDDH